MSDPLPKATKLDDTIPLMNEGYLFIKNRCEKLKSSVFETKLVGKKVICISGPEAAKIFYDPNRFERKDALPKRVQKTLTGKDSIQSLDGQAHIHRKHLFMGVLNESSVDQLEELVMQGWLESATTWETEESIVLFNESVYVLTKAACTWAGIPIADVEIESRGMDFASMVSGFGSIGPLYSKGKAARKRTEEWLQDVICSVRDGSLIVAEDCVLHAFSFHKNNNEMTLDPQTAAVELINLIRPIVAISTYITFMALALHQHPQYEKLLRNDKRYFELFVHEVRRLYPFAPFVGAIVKEDFIWEDIQFSKGTTVLLDIYGMNHSNKLYASPNTFKPERFKQGLGDDYHFIPHGGGNPATGHRCPGEGVTVKLMKTTLDFLVHKITYQLPKQEFEFDLGKIPTLPKSKIILNNISLSS